MKSPLDLKFDIEKYFKKIREVKELNES